MSFLSYSKNFQGVIDIFMNDSERYLPFTQLMASIMSGKSGLTVPQREMIALHVSNLNDCHYCSGSHKAVLSELGIDETTIGTVNTGTGADPQMQPVLDFSTKLTRQPGEVTQSDVDTLRNVGWSEQSVEDIINIVSLFAYLNRLVDGFGIQGSAEGFAKGGSMIAAHGYSPVVQMLEKSN